MHEIYIFWFWFSTYTLYLLKYVYYVVHQPPTGTTAPPPHGPGTRSHPTIKMRETRSESTVDCYFELLVVWTANDDSPPQEVQACSLLVNLNSYIQLHSKSSSTTSTTTSHSLSYSQHTVVHLPQASATPSSQHVKERLGVCDAVGRWCGNLGGRWIEVDLNRFSQHVESHKSNSCQTVRNVSKLFLCQHAGFHSRYREIAIFGHFSVSGMDFSVSWLKTFENVLYLCPVKEREKRKFGSRIHRQTLLCPDLYPVKDRP